jgi:hypothetical protein
VTLALLGAFHGLNPAMGWLFAVALGLQERRRRAVLEAIPPIALGHGASVGAVLGATALAQAAVPARALHLMFGLLLIAFGVYKLAKRNAHPRWVGMRVGFRDLTLWSLLMASAHGAGLMLVPVVLEMPASPLGDGGGATLAAHHDIGASAVGGAAAGVTALTALAVHTAALLLVMTLVALLVFEVLGVKLLRRAWINLDLLWSMALVVAGLATLLLT